MALIVEGLTDNKNRTAPFVRSAFSKFGGSLGETNSVSFQFDHVGYISYPKEVGSEDMVFEVGLEAGAEDIITADEGYEIICTMENLTAVRDAVSKKLGDPSEAKVTWIPKNTIAIDESTAKSLFKLIDILEDDDDVQTVIGNYELPEGFELD